MMVPPTWRYWVLEDRVHCFEDNESDDDDCFQLSVTPVTAEERVQWAESLGYLPSTQAGDFDCRGNKDSSSDGLVTKSWSTIYGYYYVYLTKPHYKKEYRKIELENKLKVVLPLFLLLI